MSVVLFDIKKKKKKVCVVHHDTIKQCGDIDLPRWVERLKGQIKEREETKGGSSEYKKCRESGRRGSVAHTTL